MFEPAPPDQPAVLPAPIERFLARCKRHERPLFVAAIAFQVVVLGGMALAGGIAWAAIAKADTILVPVDLSREYRFLRADYAHLRYEFTAFPKEGIDGVSQEALRRRETLPEGTPVYALLRPVPGTEVWQLDRMSLERPEDGVYLAGRLETWQIIFGIEEWELPERNAARYLQASHQHRLCAKIAVAGDGTATVRGYHVTRRPLDVWPFEDAIVYADWAAEAAPLGAAPPDAVEAPKPKPLPQVPPAQGQRRGGR